MAPRKTPAKTSEVVKKQVKKDDKAAQKRNKMQVEGVGRSESSDSGLSDDSSCDEEQSKKRTKKQIATDKETKIISKHLRHYQRNSEMSVLNLAKQTNETIEKMGESIVNGIKKALDESFARLAYPQPPHFFASDRSHHSTPSYRPFHEMNSERRSFYPDPYSGEPYGYMPLDRRFSSDSYRPSENFFNSERRFSSDSFPPPEKPNNERISSSTNDRASETRPDGASPSELEDTTPQVQSDNALERYLSNNTQTALRKSQSSENPPVDEAMNEVTMNYKKMMEIREASTSNSSLAVGMLMYLFKEAELIEEGVNLEGNAPRGSSIKFRPLSPTRVGHIKKFCIANSVTPNLTEQAIWKECKNGINKKLSALKASQKKSE